MGLNDFILYENIIQARAGVSSDKLSIFNGVEINPWNGDFGGLIKSESSLKTVPASGDIENFQGKLYYTDNLGYRKIISEESILTRQEEFSGGGSFINENEWFGIANFGVTETGYYNLQIGKSVLSGAPANNQIRITENNVVQQYNNGLEIVNAVLPFTVTGTTEYFFFFDEKSIFNFTAGLAYGIQFFTDTFHGFHPGGIRTVSLKKINYTYGSIQSGGGAEL